MDARDRRAHLPDEEFGKGRDVFVDALERGDAKAASASYTSDARLLAPSGRLFRGREAIECFWRAGVDTGVSKVELVTLELVRMGGLAYEIGCYALVLEPIDGLPVVDRGKYVRVHEEQSNRSWLWALETFNPEVVPARERSAPTRSRSDLGETSTHPA